MDSIKFKIDNLTCNGCAAGVQMVTENLDGVFAAEIDLEGKCGTWQVDLNKISAKEIQDEIQKLGYTATEITS